MVSRVIRIRSVKEDYLAAWAVVIHVGRIASHGAGQVAVLGEYLLKLIASASSLENPPAAFCLDGLLHLIIPGLARQDEVKQVIICSEHPLARLLALRCENQAVRLFPSLDGLIINHMQASIAAGYVEPSLGHVDNNGVDFGLVEIFHV
jgi:hypothetical protein